METEVVPNTFPALFQAYTVVWGLLVVYIISLGIRLRRVERKAGLVSKNGAASCCGGSTPERC